VLTELSIRDIALFPKLRVRLGPGLNVFSGETGAGKSLVVGSLRLLCGERPSPGLVRTGAARGYVEGIFELPPTGWIARELAKVGVELEDGELILGREIAPSGKGRIRANGAAIPLSTLVKASELLIDLHGQHDHQALLRSSFQLEALDEFGSLAESRAEFAALLAELRAALRELEEARAAHREQGDRADLVRFQLSELEEASVGKGELEALESEMRRLERASFLSSAAERIASELAESEPSVRDTVAALERLAAEAAESDPSFAALSSSLASIVALAEEIARDAGRAGREVVDDPARLEEVRERARLVTDLLRKYGPSEAELLAFWRKLRDEASDPEAASRRVEALEERVASTSDRLRACGSRLTRGRMGAARRLKRSVEEKLGQLGMEGTRFEVRIGQRSSGVELGPAEGEALFAGPGGVDTIDFQLAPNRGEEMRPLSATASGGEISRVMLALEAILGSKRGTATMVFDEIDLGVGGVVAKRIGEALAEIACDRQVLCITHLAAIASRAHLHLRVRKREAGGRTVSEVEPVSGEERVREVARMLGSDSEKSVALEHARELLQGGRS
jgi:DNA repair protein RecN (Recombination protein N)